MITCLTGSSRRASTRNSVTKKTNQKMTIRPFFVRPLKASLAREKKMRKINYKIKYFRS